MDPFAALIRNRALRISLYAIAFWSLYGLNYYLVNRLKTPGFTASEAIFSVPLFALIAIGTFLILRRWMTARHWWRVLVGLPVFYAAVFWLTIGLINGLNHYNQLPVAAIAPVSVRDRDFVATMIGMISNYALYGLAGFFAHRAVRQAREKQAEAEAKLQYEYLMLAGEVSPHFIANMISRWQQALHPDQQELRDELSRAHALMVYHMEARLPQKRLVPLQLEIQQLYNYRSLCAPAGREQHIGIQISGEPTGWSILPISLFVFLENAVKHGRTDLPGEPVQLSVKVGDAGVECICTNLVGSSASGMSTGQGYGHGQGHENGHERGLENLRRRLDLIYGPDYLLDAQMDGDRYLSRLFIGKKQKQRKS